MEVVERPRLYLVGIEVVAPFAQLSTAVPEAWGQLRARSDELPGGPARVLAEVSLHLGEGVYRETVGVLVDDLGPVPAGLTAAFVDAGSYVHHRHEGVVEQIAHGFQSIYDWAAEQGVALGPVKVDIGYTADGSPRPHDLFIDVVG